MRILTVTGTELFVTGPLQVVRVEVEGWPGRLDITGDGVEGHADVHSGPLVEVGVVCTAPAGATVPIRVTADGGQPVEATFTVAEPGWTVWMVPHFHYDPVWWNTQAAYTAMWDRAGRLGTQFRAGFQHTGFDLVRLHLETARRDPDYKFVLAELDYLKPYWDSHPEDRRYLRTLLSEGRLELMGGTYNEPNTNLTSAESTIRNLVHGIGFQRDVVGGDPRTAWQLDVFGHDPQFPGLVADAGLDSSSWARGPFHQWGPMLWTHEPREGWGDPSTMQFSSEFEWISPSGRGVLTHYMPAHYSAGWHIDAQPTLEGAEQSVYELFLLLKQVAATRNVLLPVGTDYTPPAKWVTEIHRDWNARYAWPRFVVGLPGEFFAAVRSSGASLSPQTRDMNPVYTGKDVSFIDTKQAQRHIEALLVDAELFATIAAAHGGGGFPHAEVDKAWRQLVYGAHHDAITGSESDQVYLDLLTGWREAHDLATSVLDGALRRLGPPDGGGPGQRVVVFNPSAWPRTDLLRVRVELPEPGTAGVSVGDLPTLLEHPDHHDDGTLAAVDVVFRATDVPSLGYRAFALVATDAPGEGWTAAGGGPVIANDFYRLVVDPARGGCVSSLVDLRTGRELLQPGRVGNELLVYDEYSAHPRFHEGPWHLLPKGPATHSSARHAADGVVVEHSPLGQRITVTGGTGPLRHTQTLTLRHGDERLELTTRVDDFTGEDHLVRLCWPAAVAGGLPVSEVGNAVVGRGFGLIDVDSEQAPWTLDNPAQHWFAVSSTARVDVHDLSGVRRHTRAIGIAEIVADLTTEAGVRDLAVALVRRGVTATASRPDGPRYGRLAVDSNLPDVRISVGRTAFTEAVLAAAGPAYSDEIDRQLAAAGRARVLVPAAKALTDVWQPNADLTGVLDLPVLVVVGTGAVAELCDDLASTGAVPVTQAVTGLPDPDLDDRTVAILNRGIPGFAVDTTGALHLSLLRSCTGWPSGVWIDPPQRTAPDGSTFQQQHWTHTFDAALVAGAGDWRATGLVRHGHEVNHPMHARVIPGTDPAAAGYVTVSSAGDVVVTALKPSGNPLATGTTAATVDSVTVRLYEAAGSPADVRLRLWTPVEHAAATNLLEVPGDALPVEDGAVLLSLGGADIAQAVVGVGPITAAAAPDAPAYAKYWLHNTGPAPTGNLPVTLHLDPPVATIGEGPAAVTVTVASDLTHDQATGTVSLDLPPGWHASPAGLAFDLAPGDFTRFPVLIHPPADAGRGVYWLQARADHGVFDVTRLLIGTDAPETVTATWSAPGDLVLRPGQSRVLGLDLETDAAAPITVDVQLVSPWHTWDLFPAPSTRVHLHSRTRLELPVEVPVGHGPGRWWALCKIAHAGELHYTAPVLVEVLP